MLDDDDRGAVVAQPRDQLSDPAPVGGVHARGRSGEGTNPEQLFAAGYAACFASALSAVARASRHDVRDVSVTAEVGLHGDTEKGFGLGVVLRVELPDDLADGEQLVERAHQICPYSNATRGNIPVDLVIE
ncbi:Ohr family peroxiredoxin [Actinomadura citrea]|uniref:Ohr family peroxiredoxin n=1 Tax=Actinomadura citrea TaxID=46158 RepID=UPI003CE478A3